MSSPSPDTNPAAPMNTMLLETGKYSDLVIKCQGKVFKLHRSIVCVQSRPLAAAVDGQFLEATTGVINLRDDDGDTFERAVHFMYTGDYCDNRKSSAGTAPQTVPDDAQALLNNTMVYVIAEKYEVSPLKTLAARKFAEVLPHEGNSPSFAASLKLMYEETPETDHVLKAIAVAFARENAKELIDRGEFASLCKENGEMGFDVLKAIVNSPKPLFRMCRYCETDEFVRTNSKAELALQQEELWAMPRKKRLAKKFATGSYHCNNCETNFD